MNSVLLQSIRYIAIDIFGSFVYYPLWWYSVGLKLAAFKFGENLVFRSHALGLGIQISNLFRPMYADYTIVGRLISFFMRIVLLIFRVLEMLVFSIWYAIVLLLWVISPIAIIVSLLHQFYIIDLRDILPFLK
ncbi:MAG TPA: hypothetical protein VJ028_00110 [Patescibacteria group bacterium]|nr:hypothetical protein [Patescibacteria group bacterium]